MKRLFAVLIGAAICFSGCRDADEQTAMDGQTECPTFVPARIVAVYLAIIEKPDASRCLLAGSRAEAYREFFERAGIKVDNLDNDEGCYDIVFVAGDSATGLETLAAKTGESGVLARVLDVREKSVAGLEEELKPLDAEFSSCHLWMPGLEDWLAIGRRQSAKVRLAAMMDVFSREDCFDDFDAAQCESLPEMFASYAGTLAEAMPAFAALAPGEAAKAQFFVTRDIPSIDWIADGDEVDGDILAKTAAEIRSMQVVRRVVLEGNIRADAQDIDGATGFWARAALRNPHDPMIVDRLERLWRNADACFRVGNFRLAAKCYDTYHAIRPNDWQSAEAFAFCLAQLGEGELAAEFHARAMKLRGDE